MKHLDTYDFYTLNESFEYQLILEHKDFSLYKTIQKKVISKLGINLYFVGTFQMGITVLYPLIDAICKNLEMPPVSKEQVVLLTVFTIAQILHVFNDDVKKIKSELDKDGLTSYSEAIKKYLLSVYNIFSFVARSFGKTVDVFTDMLGYVSLAIPTYLALIGQINKEGLLVFTGGVSMFVIKSLIESVIEAIKGKKFSNFKKQIE